MVPLAGLEPATHGLGNRCSIRLSYRGIPYDEAGRVIEAGWYPRRDSNPRTRLRRPALYPLSYGGGHTKNYNIVPPTGQAAS